MAKSCEPPPDSCNPPEAVSCDVCSNNGCVTVVDKYTELWFYLWNGTTTTGKDKYDIFGQRCPKFHKPNADDTWQQAGCDQILKAANGMPLPRACGSMTFDGVAFFVPIKKDRSDLQGLINGYKVGGVAEAGCLMSKKGHDLALLNKRDMNEDVHERRFLAEFECCPPEGEERMAKVRGCCKTTFAIESSPLKPPKKHEGCSESCFPPQLTGAQCSCEQFFPTNQKP